MQTKEEWSRLMQQKKNKVEHSGYKIIIKNGKKKYQSMISFYTFVFDELICTAQKKKKNFKKQKVNN